jgi:hypothetical protein
LLVRALSEIKNALHKGGCLIEGGYPIKTVFFKMLLKMFLPNGLAIRDPAIQREKNFFQTLELITVK